MPGMSSACWLARLAWAPGGSAVEAGMADEAAAREGPRETPPPLLVRTAGAVYRLDAGRTYRIGRDRQASIDLAHARVGWSHAVLRTEGAAWVLEDSGSLNGTYLGAERISRLKITGPVTVRVGHPEEGPELAFDLGHAAPAAWLESLSPETAAQPGVLRDPTARIPLLGKVTRIGRRTGNDIVVSDLDVSGRHAELLRSKAGQYTLIDLGSHNGTCVNGARVNHAELGEDDIIAIGRATFRLVGDELVEYVDDGRVTVEVHDLRIEARQGDKRKIRLDGISFPIAERSLTAILGLPGSGKSTLLSVLAGKVPPSRGQVWYDYRDLYDNVGELRHRIGLVPIPQVVHNQLTPQTALAYGAELRFPPDVSDDERDQRVSEILDAVSMTRHQHTRIDRLSGIGAPRSRVALGLELLTRPSLLLLDEPASGPDRYVQRFLFQDLRKLADPGAEQGQSVVVACGTNEYGVDQCDRVVVLQYGTLAYFGPPADGLRYFGRDEWPDVFADFADDPARDRAGEFRQSPEFMTHVVAHRTAFRCPYPGRTQPPPRPRRPSPLARFWNRARRLR
jgi:ABC transport system ATP-binding/permease protein